MPTPATILLTQKSTDSVDLNCINSWNSALGHLDIHWIGCDIRGVRERGFQRKGKGKSGCISAADCQNRPDPAMISLHVLPQEQTVNSISILPLSVSPSRLYPAWRRILGGYYNRHNPNQWPPHLAPRNYSTRWFIFSTPSIWFARWPHAQSTQIKLHTVVAVSLCQP